MSRPFAEIGRFSPNPVRPQVNPGSQRPDLRTGFENDRVNAARMERERGRQPTDATAENQNPNSKWDTELCVSCAGSTFTFRFDLTLVGSPAACETQCPGCALSNCFDVCTPSRPERETRGRRQGLTPKFASRAEAVNA